MLYNVKARNKRAFLYLKSSEEGAMLFGSLIPVYIKIEGDG